MPRKSLLSQEEQTKIIERYKCGSSSSSLAKEYKINVGSVLYILKRAAIQMRLLTVTSRKYEIIESYFDNIDTPDKAYFLGILYADGCNSTERNCVRLVLTKSDQGLLEKLARLIFPSGHKIQQRPGGYFKDGDKTYLRKPSCQLTIYNKHMSKVLVGHGLVKAKSLIITFPKKLQRKLLPHFVRGYFDGDGSISISNGQIQVSFIGTKDFCEGVGFLAKRIGVKYSLSLAKKDSALYQLCIHGNTGGKRFLRWLYKDADLFLDRKYEKQINILKGLEMRRQSS